MAAGARMGTFITVKVAQVVLKLSGPDVALSDSEQS